MRNLFYFILTLFVATACTQKVYPDHHTSQNSLDWAGTYTGVIQEGRKDVKTTLIIDPDYIYELHSDGNVQKGTFIWLPDGQRISLNINKKKLTLFVSENYMTQVKRSGKKIDTDKYLLVKKDNNDITDKYWKLTELFGKKIEKVDGMHEPHFILNPENNTITGFAGCNNINGEFKANSENLRISFSKLATTLRACDNMEIEDKFLDALNNIDNYSTDGKTLTLNRARMAPLARFEVVYF